MRHAIGGLLVGMVLVMVCGYTEAWGERPNMPSGERLSESQSLIALSTQLDGRQQLTLVDPNSRVLAVYHIDQTTGAIALRGVRQLHWDFQLDEFNSTNPTPHDIRAMAERR